MAWTWQFMIEVFRSLGGAVENLAQKDAGSERGIFSSDPSRIVRLHVPENLLFPVSDIEFVNGALRLKNESPVGRAERTFFETYENTFSWGDRGHADASGFIAALDELPNALKSLLSEEFGMASFFAGGEERAEIWFLNSRTIMRNGKPVLAPLLDLIRHSPDFPQFEISDGVSLEGEFSGEVFALCHLSDPMGIFRMLGIASPERVAFSSPMRNKEKGRLVIDKRINFDMELGSFPVPDYTFDGQILAFSCLMIGNKRLPRLPKGIFYRIAKDADFSNPEEAFDGILHQNRMKYFRLLAALEPYDGELVTTLRKTARYQLEAISSCIGSREL